MKNLLGSLSLVVLLSSASHVHAMTCVDAWGGNSLLSAINEVKRVSGRLGILYFGRLKSLAEQIVAGRLREYQGIPQEDYLALVAISRINPATSRAGGLLGLFGGRQAQDANLAVFSSEDQRQLLEIQSVLNRAPEALTALENTPRITENNNFVYVTTQNYIQLDLERHAIPSGDSRLPDGGYVRTPHSTVVDFAAYFSGSNRPSDYVHPSGHLVGQETIIKIHQGNGWYQLIYGVMLGSINNNWETYIIREAQTGEVILVPAREAGTGIMHEYFYRPARGPSLSEFRDSRIGLGGLRVITAGSLADATEIGRRGVAQEFLVGYPTHNQVINGVGSMRVVGDKYYVVVESTQGVQFVLPHRFLLAYTAVEGTH